MNTCFVIKEKKAKDLIKKANSVKNSLFLVKKTFNKDLKVIISVRKKFFKKAVHRNKIKRRIREIIRQEAMNKEAFYLIIVSKNLKLDMKYDKIKEKLLELL